ncbi:hypothetical protein AQ490_20015 [Wenjunlia vitaminophila]|uniref:DUF3533 domain-containing protein n=1 Tax=Wenjunlia vitaminophila TaxID=76728 RepID=A0A0T6LUB2_WENVI|nr:hypothetical protein AQ490_20015 [Wenjunlia vitaminophila]
MVFLALFIWIVGVSMHTPKPHDAPFGLVGDRAAVQPLEQQLEGAGSAFDVKVYPTAEAAREAVIDQDVLGAFVPGTDKAELMVATGIGQTPKMFYTGFFNEMAHQQGFELVTNDVAPVPQGDLLGLVAFFVFASLTVASVLCQVLFSFLARGVPFRVWFGAAVAFGLLAGTTVCLFADPVLGALDGHFLQITTLTCLYGFVIVASMAAFQALLGLPGIPLGALTLLPFGIGTSGGTVHPDFLPNFYRQISPYMASSAEVGGLRGIAYMDGSGVGRSFLVLGIWAVVALLLVGLGGMLKARRAGGAASADPSGRKNGRVAAPSAV